DLDLRCPRWLLEWLFSRGGRSTADRTAKTVNNARRAAVLLAGDASLLSTGRANRHYGHGGSGCGYGMNALLCVEGRRGVFCRRVRGLRGGGWAGVAPGQQQWRARVRKVLRLVRMPTAQALAGEVAATLNSWLARGLGLGLVTLVHVVPFQCRMSVLSR